MVSTAEPLAASGNGQRLPPAAGAGAEAGATEATATGTAATARVSFVHGARIRAMAEGSVAMLGASVFLLLVLCAWLLAAEVRLRRRRARWRPCPPPRSGARPSRVLLLTADGDTDSDGGYVQPRSVPPPIPSMPAHALPRPHSYLLLVGGDNAGAAAYEEVDGVYLRAKATGLEEGYVPMQRHRLPTVLRVVRAGARGGELALELGAACDEYLPMSPQQPHPATPRLEESREQATPVVPFARPLPPLPLLQPPPPPPRTMMTTPYPAYASCGPT